MCNNLVLHASDPPHTLASSPPALWSHRGAGARMPIIPLATLGEEPYFTQCPHLHCQCGPLGHT